MNTPVTPPPGEDPVIRALMASKAEAMAGRFAQSDQILARIAQQAPNHPAVLNELGVRMMASGGVEQAQELFARATAAEPRHPALWANLASSLKALGRREDELNAIEKALELEPRHLSALLQKGSYLEDTGQLRQAARVYQNAIDSVPPGSEPAGAVRAAFDHAKQIVEADRAALLSVLEEPLAAVRAQHGGKQQRRVDRCLDILMGSRKVYHSHPTWMYFPELPTVEFFDREDLPWLDPLEAGFQEVRTELLRVLAADREGLQPYLDFPPTMPLDQFRELNRSRRWSAYFLWNQSTPVHAHIARCPTTARLVDATPRPRINGRGPTAFFSILDPTTHIPAHVGVTNTRVTVHLPLVVPPNCGFRVGSTTREWVPGKAWMFDDTIDHEAWNMSDTPRAILLFDVWNPFLTTAERDLITKATEIFVEYYNLPQESTL